ncbi:MAG: hypothetical protein KGH75_00170 [Rhodospirillales bacterium]|nr:hypothetical protein [Rhodospirillales bacterium]
MTGTAKALLTVLVFALILAGAGVLATVVTLLSGNEVYGLVMAIGGTTVLAGGIALAGPTTSTTFVPHLLLVAAVIALTIAMGIEHVFTSTQVTGVFYLVIGPGIAVAGGTLYAAQIRRVAAAFAPPPAPPSPPAPAQAPLGVPEASTT